MKLMGVGYGEFGVGAWSVSPIFLASNEAHGDGIWRIRGWGLGWRGVERAKD